MPSNLTLFLTRDEVLEIHNKLILRFGGKSCIRDLGLLESALYRPRTGYYNNLPEMAAALFESLIMNHPFIDANKRVAFSQLMFFYVSTALSSRLIQKKRISF